MLPTDDLQDLFEANDLTETLTFGSTPIVGYFWSDYVEVLSVGSARPVFVTRTSDADLIAIGATALRSSTTYKVVVKEPDEALGMTRMILEVQ